MNRPIQQCLFTEGEKFRLSSGASSAFQFTFASDTLEIESLVMDSQISREKQSNEVDDSLRRPMRTEFSGNGGNGSKFQRFIEYFHVNTMFACRCSEMIYYTCNMKPARRRSARRTWVSWHVVVSVSSSWLRRCKFFSLQLRKASLTLCFTDHLKI